MKYNSIEIIGSNENEEQELVFELKQGIIDSLLHKPPKRVSFVIDKLTQEWISKTTKKPASRTWKHECFLAVDTLRNAGQHKNKKIVKEITIS